MRPSPDIAAHHLPGEDLDVLPLYVETRLDRSASELASELLTESLGKTTMVQSTDPTVVQSTDPTGGIASVGETQSSIRFGASLAGKLPAEAVPRQSAMISEGRRVSFATYFNAFPASY